MKINKNLKKLFWNMPLPSKFKEKLRKKYAEIKFAKEEKESNDFQVNSDELCSEYAKYILQSYSEECIFKKNYEVHENSSKDSILIAYYLTQYSPDEHNDLWWGKGTTEWNNVCKAVPQFVGHYQPRLPGELGFYDLRIKENMARQIEIAKNYGIDVFSFYYYWFAGERILEKPLNMFLEDKSLNMPFMFCWANENWTKRFSGVDENILIGMENSEDNYKNFIHEVIPYFKDDRYFKINNKVVLQIYRPGNIPNIQAIIAYWRQEVKKSCGCDLYLLAVQEMNQDWISKGFDAENEWMQGSIKKQCNDITQSINTIRKDFSGDIMDYENMVNEKKYILEKNQTRKVYPAIMPSWDNSARRNHRGVIWHGSNPELYKKWLMDLIINVKKRTEENILDCPMIFINAWNEWGEGAYLEPDRKFGFAYLQATWEAKSSRSGE